MLGIVDPKDGTLRMFRIVMTDVVVILVFIGLIMLHVVSLYLTVLIGYPTLFAANFLVIWKASRRRLPLPKENLGVPKLLWFAAAAFTTGSVVEIVFWVRSPDIRSTIQALGGSVMAGYFWFLIGLNKARARQG